MRPKGLLAVFAPYRLDRRIIQFSGATAVCLADDDCLQIAGEDRAAHKVISGVVPFVAHLFRRLRKGDPPHTHFRLFPQFRLQVAFGGFQLRQYAEHRVIADRPRNRRVSPRNSDTAPPQTPARQPPPSPDPNTGRAAHPPAAAPHPRSPHPANPPAPRQPQYSSHAAIASNIQKMRVKCLYDRCPAIVRASLNHLTNSFVITLQPECESV